MPYKNIFFIGIGGIGMSALACMLKSHGINVSGSDSSNSKVTDNLIKEGIEVFIGHEKKHIENDFNAVIYTLAISNDNPELQKAKELNIPLFTYAEFLGKVSNDYKTIAVSGTHGKTTTTAMIAKVLEEGGLSPNVIVGSLLVDKGTNFVKGESDLFVVEACEYKRSFLNLSPWILVITNIEEDHLDYYKDLADIQNAFKVLAMKVPKEGFIITDTEDQNIKPVLEGVAASIIDYKKYIPNYDLNVSGEHNLKNSACALALAKILNVSEEQSKTSLVNFKGTWRRFEFKGEMKNGAIVYDDYAHHPTEILATLNGLKSKFSNKKIVAFFQPHLYSRTKSLLNDFGKSFKDADMVYVLPIYAAREEFDDSISNSILKDKILENGTNSNILNNLEEINSKMEELGDSDTVFITLGAGDIYTVFGK
jgi:UDP-N-acetylmuramate--alanine ligase